MYTPQELYLQMKPELDPEDTMGGNNLCRYILGLYRDNGKENGNY